LFRSAAIFSKAHQVTLQVFNSEEKQQLFTFPLCESTISHANCPLSLCLKISHLNKALFTHEGFGNVLAMDLED
jgi:hypothetical protein